MWLNGSVRIICVSAVAASLMACAQPQSSQPLFFQDGVLGIEQRRPVSEDGVITIRRGDTLFGIARTYNVPVSELADQNDLTLQDQLIIGQRLVLPSDDLATGSIAGPAVVTAPVVAAQPVRVASVPKTAPQYRTHVVRSGENLYRISLKNDVPLKQVAALNGIDAPYALRVGQKLKLPGAVEKQFAKSVDKPAAPPRFRHAKVEPASYQSPIVETASLTSARLAEPVVPKSRWTVVPRLKPAVHRPSYRTTNSRFIWPVQGKVISPFGTIGKGLRNDGINIRTDEGTPVRAADSGIVTYAGNELRGYGNLLLVKHDGGYITAYAHNSALHVKRGSRVERGQVIASSGRTGNVEEPQLHFEIRKGATAVNPKKYLDE